MAVLKLKNLISDTIEKADKGIGVFLDLRKAFDTVNHERLVNKLGAYGLDGISLALLRSYLQNRKQIFLHSGLSSREAPISVGVPQGSCLGPLLFNIYINDIAKSLNTATTITFADDTVLFLRCKTVSSLMREANKELDALSLWLFNNGLVLNFSKTKFMIFSNYCSKDKGSHLNLHEKDMRRNCEIFLERVTVYKYLGVMLTETLHQKPHIQYIVNKTKKGLAILYRLQFCSGRHLRRMVYLSLIESHIAYCIGVYGGTFQSTIKSIYTIQKKSLRFVAKQPPLSSAEPLFELLHIRTHLQLYVSSLLLHQHTPVSWLERPQHEYSTRFNEGSNLSIPRARTSRGQRSQQHHYSRIFNSMSPVQKNIIANRFVIPISEYRKAVRAFVCNTPHQKLIELLY